MGDKEDETEEEAFMRELHEGAEKKALSRKSRVDEVVGEKEAMNTFPEVRPVGEVPEKDDLIPELEITSDLGKLRFLEEVDEKMRKETLSTMRKHIYIISNDVHELVTALWTKTRCIVSPEDAYRMAMNALVEELERVGVLFPEVTRRYPHDLYEAIKRYMLALPEGSSRTRSDILRDIGRNHGNYYEAADYFLERLCNEKYIKRRGKRYLK